MDDVEAMMHNEDAMKKRDDRPLTKEDAKQFATKDDLAHHAKESNARMDGLDGRLDEMTSVIRRQSLAIVKNQTSIDTLTEKISAMFQTMESRNAARMDAFMSNTLRVDHDNILLVHRMDAVEGRVSALERRAP